MKRFYEEPLTIGEVEFKNRVWRSSIGGRSCNYDGTLTDVWKNFEKRFAKGSIAAIVSTTFGVNRYRLSPLQYPSIADDRNVRFLERFLPQIQYACGKSEKDKCRYIVQIGDPGYATQTSLFPEERDSLSSSNGWDLAYGYNNRRTEMSARDIDETIRDFKRAARRVAESGADGIEVTLSKGYLLHQFLHPGINRRKDDWGGDPQRRFRLLREVLQEVRNEVGRKFLLGVRLAHNDFTKVPLLFYWARWPHGPGNDSEQVKEYAVELARLGVNYLHVCGGFGFPNPRDIPGRFPTEEIRMHFNATRHLSFKAYVRSVLLNTIPLPIADWACNIDWTKKPGINLEGAIGIKKHVEAQTGRKIDVIVNGGFQERVDIEDALDSGMSAVSMARALIANRFLLHYFRRNEVIPEARKCTYCSRCVGRTPTSPFGCYEPSRFTAPTPEQTQRRMQNEILRWNRSDRPARPPRKARAAATS